MLLHTSRSMYLTAQLAIGGHCHTEASTVCDFVKVALIFVLQICSVFIAVSARACESSKTRTRTSSCDAVVWIDAYHHFVQGLIIIKRCLRSSSTFLGIKICLSTLYSYVFLLWGHYLANNPAIYYFIVNRFMCLKTRDFDFTEFSD